jgi:SAM-dependent methyltransferase
MSSEAAARAGEDVENVRSFFDQWAIYRRVIERNYLFHREAYAEVDRVLGGFGSRAVSVLDLGSGDASYMAGVLGRHAVAAYHGVDISPVALSLARENVGRLGCPAEFTQGDFFALVPTLREAADFVYIGLSLHHLPLADKGRFLADLRRVVKPGGCLLVCEPICHAGESRSAVLDRWGDVVSRKWTALSAEDMAAVKGHVFGNDYPESIGTYDALGRTAGFAPVAVRFTCPDELYAVLEFRPAGEHDALQSVKPDRA